MNVHDSERIAGLLESMGYHSAENYPSLSSHPDIIVFNTCAIRENAANRLYGTLSNLVPLKKEKPNMLICVGGCLGQMDKDNIIARAPYVDVVFGTHNIGSLPELLRRSQHNRAAAVEIHDSLVTFPSHLPAKRDSYSSAWVSISVGCNNTCTYCIVPSLRGKEVDRPMSEILAEITMLIEQGVTEVILLGQNVNSYGVNFTDSNVPRNRHAFAELLRECSAISGLKRLRFTSPHPAEFSEDVLTAMSESSNICPSLHIPLQSGSDRILKLMRRSYRRDKFMRIIDKARELMPNIALSTDIIVGFPSETEADFCDTLDIMQRAQFVFAYTFQYSQRPGTEAAMMTDQVPAHIVAQRYQQLVAVQDDISWSSNRKLEGHEVEVLVNAGAPKKNHSRLTGRARDGRLVHFVGDPQEIRPGDYVKVAITGTSPHFVISDSGVISHTRTVAGDKYYQDQIARKEQTQKQTEKTASAPEKKLLGLPQIGRPQPRLNEVKDSCSL